MLETAPALVNKAPKVNAMSDTRINSSALKVLEVMFALSSHSLSGLSNSELARGLNESPATINRCLNTLITAGAATKLDNGRYAPGVRMLQAATAHANEMARASDRINELNQRVMAGSF